jgi:hypothetical protein
MPFPETGKNTGYFADFWRREQANALPSVDLLGVGSVDESLEQGIIRVLRSKQRGACSLRPK